MNLLLHEFGFDFSWDWQLPTLFLLSGIVRFQTVKTSHTTMLTQALRSYPPPDPKHITPLKDFVPILPTQSEFRRLTVSDRVPSVPDRDSTPDLSLRPHPNASVSTPTTTAWSWSGATASSTPTGSSATTLWKWRTRAISKSLKDFFRRQDLINSLGTFDMNLAMKMPQHTHDLRAWPVLRLCVYRDNYLDISRYVCKKT